MPNEATRPVDSARELYFVPEGDAAIAITTGLASAQETVEASYQQVSAAFVYNVETAHSTLSMPYAMACMATMDQRWLNLYSVAFIRLKRVDPNERDARSRQTVKDELTASLGSAEGRELFKNDACQYLLKLLKNPALPDWGEAVSELVRQGTILIWSALEVLARDILELDLNNNPHKLADFAADPDARKRYGFDRISLDVVLASGLDLSNKMGSIVTRSTDFSDLPGMKLALRLLFPQSEALRAALDDRKLWELYQRRNLIAHRRGIVDQAYLDKTGEVLPVGSSIQVKPSDLDGYFECVIEVGQAILDCCPKRAAGA